MCALLDQSGLAKKLGRSLVVMGDENLLRQRAQAIGIHPGWQVLTDQGLAPDQHLGPGMYLWPIPLAAACQPGVASAENAPYVLALLDKACDACLGKQAAAMVTAPIQKSAISPYWPGFMGHTEYLAERCGTPQVVMMLAGGGMRVALATTHLPLAKVPGAITPPLLRQVLQITLQALQQRWGLQQPTVLVTGLNPHAGESGDLGHEDGQIIAPVIAEFQAKGYDVRGPYPADTLFQPKYLDQADAVLAMYHDQGLPVLKFASFGQGVNITLGLPIVRTSVDHGTALDLAGTRNMNPGSLFEAIETAHAMSRPNHTS